MKHRYILFIEIETKEKWQEPTLYMDLAEKTIRKWTKDVGNIEITFSHPIEIKDEGLYNILYQLVTKLAYGKKLKKRRT